MNNIFIKVGNGYLPIYRGRFIHFGNPSGYLLSPRLVDRLNWTDDETYITRHYIYQSGSVSVSGVDVSKAEFWLDNIETGIKIGEVNGDGPVYQLDFNSTGLIDGSHMIYSRLYSGDNYYDTPGEPINIWNGPESPPDLSDVVPESDTIYLKTTGAVDSSGNSIDTTGLLSFNSTTKTYTLLRNAVFPGVAFVIAGTSITLDLNGFTIGFNNAGDNGDGAANASSNTRCGIFIAQNYQTSQGTYLGITETTPGTTSEVKNGTIVQMVPNLIGQAAIFASDLRGLFATDLKIFTSGKDACGIRSTYSFSNRVSEIKNCRFIVWCPHVTNRHSGPSCIWIASDPVIIQDCILLGGHCGITCGAPAGRSGNTVIERNIISNLNPDTNGYALRFFQTHDIYANDNVCIGINNRGIVIDGTYTGSGTCLNHNLSGNIVLVWEHPNKEYGDNLSPAGLRMRYKVSDLIAIENRFLGICGESVNGNPRSINTHAYNDTCYPPTSGDAGSNVFISGNYFDSIQTGETALGHICIGAAFNGRQDGASCTFVRNVCRSNAYPFGISGGEADSDLRDSEISENTIAFVSGRDIVYEFLDSSNSKISEIGFSGNSWASWVFSLVSGELNKDIMNTALISDRATMFSLTSAGNSLKTDMYIDMLKPTFYGGAAIDLPSDVHVRHPTANYAINIRVDANGDGIIGSGDHQFVRSGGTTGSLIKQLL